jgi:hypothetical protein
MLGAREVARAVRVAVAILLALYGWGWWRRRSSSRWRWRRWSTCSSVSTSFLGAVAAPLRGIFPKD